LLVVLPVAYVCIYLHIPAVGHNARKYEIGFRLFLLFLSSHKSPCCLHKWGHVHTSV